MEKTAVLVIEATKEFTVPLERLYEAWTREADLKQWWKPMGNTLTAVTNELKPGGSIRYSFESPEHNPAFEIHGAYQEVAAAQKLVYTWNWEVHNNDIQESEFQLTIIFSAQGSGSRLHVKQENFKSEEALQPHKQGWEKSLNDLKLFLG